MGLIRSWVRLRVRLEERLGERLGGKSGEILEGKWEGRRTPLCWVYTEKLIAHIKHPEGDE